MGSVPSPYGTGLSIVKAPRHKGMGKAGIGTKRTRLSNTKTGKPLKTTRTSGRNNPVTTFIKINPDETYDQALARSVEEASQLANDVLLENFGILEAIRAPMLSEERAQVKRNQESEAREQSLKRGKRLEHLRLVGDNDN